MVLTMRCERKEKSNRALSHRSAASADVCFGINTTSPPQPFAAILWTIFPVATSMTSSCAFDGP